MFDSIQSYVLYKLSTFRIVRIVVLVSPDNQYHVGIWQMFITMKTFKDFKEIKQREAQKSGERRKLPLHLWGIAPIKLPLEKKKIKEQTKYYITFLQCILNLIHQLHNKVTRSGGQSL